MSWLLQLGEGTKGDPVAVCSFMRGWSQALVMPRDGMRGNGDEVQQGKLWLNVRSVLAHGSGAALEQYPERW